MSELSPLNDVVADDLLLDRLGSGGAGDPEPVAVMLQALASYAAAPLPHRRGRRSRRHRLLSGLAVLAVGASGAGVAAAVTQPNQALPDDALAIHAPALSRPALPDRSSSSALTEVRLSAVASAGGFDPVTRNLGVPRVVLPDAAPGPSDVGGPADATDHLAAGAAASSPDAGSATSEANTPSSDASSPGSGASSPSSGAGSVTPGSQPAGGDGPAADSGAGTAGSTDSGAAKDPASGAGAPESGGTAPAPGADAPDSSSSTTDAGQGLGPDGTAKVPAQDPADRQPKSAVGKGQADGRGQGADPAQPAGNGSAPGQVKRQLQPDVQSQAPAGPSQAPGQLKRGSGAAAPTAGVDPATAAPAD